MLIKGRRVGGRKEGKRTEEGEEERCLPNGAENVGPPEHLNTDVNSIFVHNRPNLETAKTSSNR